MVLLRVRRGLHAPTKYLELSESHPIRELIPSVSPDPRLWFLLTGAVCQLCQQLGMFGAEDMGLYRCPPIPTVLGTVMHVSRHCMLRLKHRCSVPWCTLDL